MAFGLRNGQGHAHAMTGLHALHKTVDFHRARECEPRGEAGAHPERIGGFAKHSAGADVARASTQQRGAPFHPAVGTERTTPRPAAVETSGSMIPTGHASRA